MESDAFKTSLRDHPALPLQDLQCLLLGQTDAKDEVAYGFDQFWSLAGRQLLARKIPFRDASRYSAQADCDVEVMPKLVFYLASRDATEKE